MWWAHISEQNFQHNQKVVGIDGQRKKAKDLANKK